MNVDVWIATLDGPAAEVDAYAHLLAADEAARAAGFHFERDRRRFVVARGVLRALLADYVGTRPDGLEFGYGQWGKPYLVCAGGPSSLRFNVSHSEDVAVYAVGRGRDVERLRSVPEIDQIADRFFSPNERRALASVAPAQKQAAFFNCWTRKEAYIKARGEGLALPLDQFNVSLIPGQPAALLCTVGDPAEAERWSLQALNVRSGFVAAVAIGRHPAPRGSVAEPERLGRGDCATIAVRRAPPLRGTPGRLKEETYPHNAYQITQDQVTR